MTHRETGDRLSVMVVEIRGDKTRLGFDAGNLWIIDREEIDAIRTQRKGLGDGRS